MDSYNISMIFKYIDPLYFFASLCFGILVVYISSPIPDVIVKYPTLDNAGKLTYKDEHGVCYRYIAKEVSCPPSAGSLVREMMTEEKPPKHEEKGILYNLLERITKR